MDRDCSFGICIFGGPAKAGDNAQTVKNIANIILFINISPLIIGRKAASNRLRLYHKKQITDAGVFALHKTALRYGRIMISSGNTKKIWPATPGRADRPFFLRPGAAKTL
jgi:hypothetical protein